MRLPFLSLTRRQAVISMAFAATATASSTNILPVTLIVPRKQSDKEILRRVALTRDYVFAIWGASLAVRASSRLACYDLTGNQYWSAELGPSALVDLISSNDTEVAVVAINLASKPSNLAFSKYNNLGVMNQQDSLPLNRGVLAVATSPTHIYALDGETGLLAKRFGAAEAVSRLPPAFDTPVMGGITPRAIFASVHVLNNELLLLDHMKARTVKIMPNGEQQPGRIMHPIIDAALERQDHDVESRLAMLRSSGKEDSITFPMCISYAASDRLSSIWIAASLIPSSISVYLMNSTPVITGAYTVQIPANPIVRNKPPLMLAASPSTIALGFRDGVIALAQYKEA